MAKKKMLVGENPSVNPTPVEQPKPTQDELNALGIRDHQVVISNKPVETGTRFGVREMAFKDSVETRTWRQPYLNEEEVKKLGIRGWWLYRGGDFTTVTGGNRFLLKPDKFQDLKDKGLVIHCGLSEAAKWRNK